MADAVNVLRELLDINDDDYINNNNIENLGAFSSLVPSVVSRCFK